MTCSPSSIRIAERLVDDISNAPGSGWKIVEFHARGPYHCVTSTAWGHLHNSHYRKANVTTRGNG